MESALLQELRNDLPEGTVTPFDSKEALASLKQNSRPNLLAPRTQRMWAEWQESNQATAALYCYMLGIEPHRAERFVTCEATMYHLKCKSEDKVTVDEQRHDPTASVFVVPLMAMVKRLQEIAELAKASGVWQVPQAVV